MIFNDHERPCHVEHDCGQALQLHHEPSIFALGVAEVGPCRDWIGVINMALLERHCSMMQGAIADASGFITPSYTRDLLLVHLVYAVRAPLTANGTETSGGRWTVLLKVSGGTKTDLRLFAPRRTTLTDHSSGDAQRGLS